MSYWDCDCGSAKKTGDSSGPEPSAIQICDVAAIDSILDKYTSHAAVVQFPPMGKEIQLPK